MTPLLRRVVLLGSISLCAAAPARGSDYPLALTLDATAGTGTAAITATVTVHVNSLMLENRHTRVADALRYSGYANFLTALRALPPIGSIGVGTRTVEVRYAYEQREGTTRRLVLVADRPLVFVGGNPGKSRAGYELTLVELRFDGDGAVTGTMAGAARVKPSATGPVIDDYADALVRLASRQAR